MDRAHEYYQSYSWHQSHDQATILLLVPYETTEDEVEVTIERNYLVAGVRGQPPIVKGRLYGGVDISSSDWQLEPHAHRPSARERATSTSSNPSSNDSSFAVVTSTSEPDFSSSFAASLEAGLASDFDDPLSSSPALSSPISFSMDEHFAVLNHRRRDASRATSPPAPAPASLISSYSSMESLHTASGRLLTLHLEKSDSMIWPSLIVGPVPETLSPAFTAAYPWASAEKTEDLLVAEAKYNMDSTSLVLVALDLYDIRKLYDEAFEYFVRAWHQAHIPSATIRLATHYVPLHSILPKLTNPTPSPIESSPSSSMSSFNGDLPTPTSTQGPPSGSAAYYITRLGGGDGLAQLFLSAGILHLEGAATPLLTSAYAGLSSLRSPLTAMPTAAQNTTAGSTEQWRRDRTAARRFFDRAKALVPTLDVPLLPPETESDSGSGPESVGMPESERERGGRRGRSGTISSTVHPLDHKSSKPKPNPAEEKDELRRRRKKELGELSNSFLATRSDVGTEADDGSAWYLYIPGIVGAGTALLVVGFLSFSSWRKSQGS